MRLFIGLFISILSFISCSNGKSTISESSSQLSTEETKKLVSLGYKKAAIEDFSSESGCGFLIVLEKDKSVLQPLKPLAQDFNHNFTKVWVKYRPIRPTVPKCKKGQLIDLEDIKLR